METFSKIICENIFTFIILTFLGGLIVGVLGVKKVKGVSKIKRETSKDYLIGIFSFLNGDIDEAIKKLSIAVDRVPYAIEAYLILGNIYRRRGQLEKAIKIHRDLLKRSDLKDYERILVLNALGTDYKIAGFLDRALKTFKDVLALNPKDIYALSMLVRLSEDRDEWDMAYEYAKMLFKLTKNMDSKILSFQLIKKGEMLESQNEDKKALYSFKKAIKIYRENTVAYYFLMKVYLKLNEKEKARELFENVIEKFRDKAHLFLEIGKEIYEERYLDVLKNLAFEKHIKRAFIVYIEELLKNQKPEEAKKAIIEFSKLFPRSRYLHRKIISFISSDFGNMEFLKSVANNVLQKKEALDPFVCVQCGYKTIDVLLRCPNCKEWNSFIDMEN